MSAAGTSEQAVVRSPLPRSVVVLIGTAAAIVIAGGIKFASGLVAPTMLALVLTIAVAPIPRWVRSKGAPAWLATLVALVAVYILVLLLAGGVAISIVKLATVLPQYAGQAEDLVNSATTAASKAGMDTTQVHSALSHLDLGRLLGFVGDLLSSLLDALGNMFFLVTLLFFLGAEVTLANVRAEQLRAVRPNLSAALSRFVSGTMSYLIVTTVFGAIVAVLDTLALWALGVPLPVTWGLLAFLTNFIPNIGFVIGVIPPALLGLLSGGWGTFFAVLAVYCVINVVLQTFIQPRFVGDAVGLSTLMTYISLILWAYLLGALGALLAVPMSLLLRAFLVDADPEMAWSRVFFTSVSANPKAPKEPPPEPPPQPPAEPPQPAVPQPETG
ncbi:AI-2E family transporter [Angustibacter sp. McL0619]|uniref:AI-2E family transporter n=1 Tax=Angustibacter sp. McL0619 TaxID=3415676 RepID=UPI003CFB1E70